MPSHNDFYCYFSKGALDTKVQPRLQAWILESVENWVLNNGLGITPSLLFLFRTSYLRWVHFTLKPYNQLFIQLIIYVNIIFICYK